MSLKYKIILVFSGLLLVLMVVLKFSVETTDLEPASQEPITDPEILEGKRLSEIHCSTCHKYPDPGLLPWRTWRFETLGAMAPFLGIDDPNSAGHSRDQRSNPHIPENICPSEPQVTQAEWQKIRNYYLYAAPKELPRGEKKPGIKSDPLFFKAQHPVYRSENLPSISITSTRYNLPEC